MVNEGQSKDAVMAIRRFREHVRRQDWFAVLIDIGIVVIGVFLGIQAANWNEARIERSEADEYRARIIANLRANEADVAARIAYYRQVRHHAIAALDSLQSNRDRSDEQFLIDAYQASQGWFRPLQQPSYDESVDSSVRRKIGEPAVRAQLSAYYQLASGFDSAALGVTPYRDRLRRAMDLRVQLAIRQRCDDIMVDLPEGGQAPRLPERCSLNLDPRLLERVARQVAAVPELDQDLTRLVIDIDQKLGLFGRAARDAERLRQSLERT
jgi:hypothetical protein